MHKKIDLTKMSAHFIIDRADRINYIEKTVGWGTVIVEAPDPIREDVRKALTSTGVLIIFGREDIIITAWIADVNQALRVWLDAKNNNHLPKWLWNVINYNNNTEYWRNKVAA